MKQTSLCYIENDGSYLMMHRTKKKNDENSGKWIGIGGKFAEGESPDDCMLRETREETGLTLSSWQYRAVVTFVSDLYETEHMHLFTAVSKDRDFINCDEGELRWIPKNEILNLCLWEGDKIFLALMEKSDYPFFSLKLVYRGDNLVSAILNGKEEIVNGNF